MSAGTGQTDFPFGAAETRKRAVASGFIFRQTENRVFINGFRNIFIRREQQNFQFFRKFSVMLNNFKISVQFNHCELPDSGQERAENLCDFLFRIMIRADIQNDGTVRPVIEQTFIALIRFQHEIFPCAAPEIPGGIGLTESVDQSACQHSRIFSQPEQSFRQP